MRKNVLKYDDVMNKQRTVIYEQRSAVLEGVDLSGQMKDWIDEVVERNIRGYTESEFSEQWDLEELCKQMEALYGSEITAAELREEVELTPEALIDEFSEDAWETYQEREQEFGADPETGQPIMRELERYIVLNVVDVRWREHLESMDYLREGVHLRAMAQKDPLVEYTAEGHKMFEELNGIIREEVVLHLFHAVIEPGGVEELGPDAQSANGGGPNGGLSYQHESVAGSDAIAAAGATAAVGITAGNVGGGATSVATQTQRVVADHQKLGRNDPCWCGSGKKFKKCHGA
jgi:preprotein translocase subunit SecA